MSDTVVLAKPHGMFKVGDEFEVYRKSPSTTIVHTSEGRRVILPNSKLSGAQERVLVELNAEQYKVYARLKGGEDSLDTGLLEDYAKGTGLNAEEALADVEFIEKHRAEGAKFTVISATGEPLTVAAEMSQVEREVLEELLGGDKTKWDSEDLGVTVTEEEEEPEPELGPNQIWFTDITGGRLPESGINHVIQTYADDHFPESIRVDIPKVKPDHYWDCEVLEVFVLAHQLREKAMITGMPGTGKSSSVNQFAAWIKQPYMRLGGRGDLESASFLGCGWTDVEEHDGNMLTKMVFKPGMLAQGLDTEGAGYLVTIDEVWKIPAYIQMSMQHLYEKDGFLTIDDLPGSKADKIIEPAPEFMLILTDNVKGTGDNFDKFAATQMQDTSTLDRINLNETLEYLQPKDEIAMLQAKYLKQDKALITKLVKFAGLVRNGYKQGSIALTLSPRGLIAILDMIEVGVPTQRAISLAYGKKIADETEHIAIGDMIRTVGL